MRRAADFSWPRICLDRMSMSVTPSGASNAKQPRKRALVDPRLRWKIGTTWTAL